MVLMQGRSKTDPNGQVCVANDSAAEDELCLVALLKRLHRQRPNHFADLERFFFTLSNGQVLHRERIAALLRLAADASDTPRESVAAILLRSGGASVMWDAGYAAEVIKRRGRWASDCYRMYVWEGRDRARDLAKRMPGSKFSLMASLAAYRRHGQ